MSTINRVAHGLTAGTRVVFSDLVGGSPIDVDTVYHVLTAGLTADAFQISEFAEGTPLTFAVLTSASMQVVPETTDTDPGLTSYAPITDPTVAMAPPIAPTNPTGLSLSSAVVIDNDGHALVQLLITLVQPASATLRHTVVVLTPPTGSAVKIVIPKGQTTASVQGVQGNAAYGAVATSFDTFGLESAASNTATHTTTGDSTAPGVPTGLAALGAIRGLFVSWTAVAATDLSHYDLAVSSDGGATYPTVYKVKTVMASITQLLAQAYFVKVRAVDLSGNASAYSAPVNATSRLVTGGAADILATSITAADIAADTITANQIAANAITTSELNAGAVTSDKVVAGAILTNKLSVGAAASVQSLVPNFSFEDETSPGSTQPASWTGFTSGVGSSVYVETSTGSKHGGKRLVCYAPVITTSYAFAQSETFPVVAGEKLYMSCWYLGAGGLASNSVYIGIIFYDSAGFTIGSRLDIVSSGAAPVAWTKAEGYVTAPVGAVIAVAALFNFNPNVANGYLVFDQVIVQRMAGGVQNSTATVVIDSAGITILNGALTIQDEFGKTTMVASGFSGNWADFIATGLYNGRFLSGTAGGIANGRTSNLPYWTLANLVGTPFAIFVANGGVDVSFNALTDKKGFTSDSVQVHPAGIYQANFTVSTVKASATMFIILATFIDWFKADGTASATPTTTLDQNSFSGTLAATAINTLLPVRPPSDARFAKLRFTIEESNLGAHNSGNKLTLLSSSFKEVANTSVGIGAAFPVTPAPLTYDRFFHTGYQMEFFYQGTRWVSSQLYEMPLGTTNSAAAIAATTASLNRAVAPELSAGAPDIWLVDHHAGIFVAGGGTALGALHKWVGTLNARSGNAVATLKATSNLDSGASTTYRTIITAINALMNNGVIQHIFDTTWTKTGTPGNITPYESITYRLVG